MLDCPGDTNNAHTNTKQVGYLVAFVICLDNYRKGYG